MDSGGCTLGEIHRQSSGSGAIFSSVPGSGTLKDTVIRSASSSAVAIVRDSPQPERGFRTQMSDTSRTSSRRDALKTIGGVLGGVSLLGHGTARGQAVGFMPSGYKFYRLLTANEGGNFGGTQN